MRKALRWYAKCLAAGHSVRVILLAVVLAIYDWNERKIAQKEAEPGVFTECEMDTLSRLKYRYQNTEEMYR